MHLQVVPKHVAIIMDGNGRWAKQRRRPRIWGHRTGAKVAKKIIRAVDGLGCEALTLFAFSTENWQRPLEEVKFLMGLFVEVLKSNIRELHAENVRVRVIGDVSSLDDKLQALIRESEELTANNTGLKLSIAISYSGQWDIVQASRALAQQVQQGDILPEQIDQERFNKALCLSDVPLVDLLIRTSGEMRISNFLLWQIAYSELYFTDTLWPDFGIDELHRAFHQYSQRQRRFGQTGEQLSCQEVEHA